VQPASNAKARWDDRYHATAIETEGHCAGSLRWGRIKPRIGAGPDDALHNALNGEQRWSQSTTTMRITLLRELARSYDDTFEGKKGVLTEENPVFLESTTMASES
jgi:hypothetical protein